MIHRYVQRDKKQSISEEVLYSLLKEPIVTEKSTLQQEQNQYFFKVESWASKISVKKAIEHIFNVKVQSVNILVLKGKTRRFRGRIGVRSDMKKAMVRLCKGENLNFATGAAA